jgi:hypothetical protein
MRRVRGAGLCFAAVGVVLVLAAASAQAVPGSLEFGRCVAATGGKFLNPVCTKVAKPGKELYEWEPLTAGIAARGGKERNTGNVVFEASTGTQISCPGMTEREGEFGPASKEELNIVWVFTRCSAGFAECNSTGAIAGEVVWNKLRGVPGIVKAEAQEAKDIVGVAFSPQSGTDDAEFACGPAPVVVRGGVIVKMQADSTGGTTGELTNKMLNKFELEFLAEEGGKQVPESFEGEPSETLEQSLAGNPFQQTSLTMTFLQETSPKTTKVELRKCEANVC